MLNDGFAALTGCASSASLGGNCLNSTRNESVCLSEKCIRLAANYLNNMNRQANPCSDFYTFACGRYAENKVVPEHAKKITVLYEMKRDLDRHLKGRIFPIVGVDKEDDAGMIDYQVNDIIDMERRIANASFRTLSRSDFLRNHSAISNLMTYKDFRHRYPQIRWSLFFNEELRESLGTLDDDMMVNVVDIGYFDGLSSLMKSKPLSSINNYMMWRLVSTFDVYLAQQYRIPAQKFHANMYGSTAEVPKWENCVHNVAENMAMPLSTAYASSYFSVDDREKAEEMITDLKSSMQRLLIEADWMDELTRSAALKKLDRMRHKIGFPDALLNETAVLAPYEGVQIAVDNFFDNALQLKRAAVRNVLSRIKKPPTDDDWASPVIAVDAFHYFAGNEIIFPAAILQFPMFVPEAPFSVNYAAIGLGIGHEITHGYDDLGSQYDDLGNLRRWWDHTTLETFQKKRQCFINQYNRQVEPNTHRNVDGRLTIGENIADNGGLRVAYEAYRKRSLRESEFAVLPGFSKFSAEQLFFVAYANTWCEAIKSSSINYIMDTDVHALGMFRVNVPLQNFPPFSEAFHCPVGSPMNPYEKCRIW
ncbi:peptidase family M13 [Necator americanus]|uniref:Peptidase family M13 n=1 Tax=Necator americanus TaxID=51031 RepID=W2SLD8_NECAM|nr:peptidase family M13 [Necator americanus]ETN70425.1 peptidase family M13 [Necator americanus]